MRTGRVLIAAVLFLGSGIWVLFAYCTGNAGVTFGDSLSACKLTLDLTTVGIPMLVGVPLALLGLLLMAVALIAAIVSQFRRPAVVVKEEVSPRRGIPFEG